MKILSIFEGSPFHIVNKTVIRKICRTGGSYSTHITVKGLDSLKCIPVSLVFYIDVLREGI
jgi:hypothetical protein